MRNNRRPCPNRSSSSEEGPPAITGDLDTDAEATLSWLWSHPERWLGDDAPEATSNRGDAA